MPLLLLTAAVAAIVGAVAGTFWRAPSPSLQVRWTGVLLGGPATLMQPELSPDGQLLAFQAMVDGQTQIAVMQPALGTWRVLTTDRSRGLITAQDWAKDGSRIFYDRSTDTLNGIYAVPTLGGDERLVFENAAFPIALSNGDLLVERVNAQRQYQLYRFAPSNGQPEPLPVLPDVDGSDDVVEASADGRRAYFFGKTLANPTAPSAFFELDLETQDIKPLALSVSLRRPVSMAIEPGTSNVLLGGVDGDAFHIVRVSGSPGPDGPRPRWLMVPRKPGPPATAVGPNQAALMMGPSGSPDVAIVNTADGRLVRRFKAPSAAITTMAASPDGRTLYYTDAGSVWSLSAEGGTPTKIGPGDSLTIDPDSGDLIIKLDEGARFRLIRSNPRTGQATEIPIHGDLRLVQRPLMPGSVRQGRMVLPVASTDSWFWHAVILDLKTGVVTKLSDRPPSDFHFTTWRADGMPIGFGYGLDTSLWRFTPRPQ